MAKHAESAMGEREGEGPRAMTRDTQGPALSDRALGRALLARQGLLEPYSLPLTEVVERIGAVQSQYWPAPPVALFSRMREVTRGQVHEALATRKLVNGILIRGTLHLVSAREHPAYSAVAELAGTNDWRHFVPKSLRNPPPLDELRRALHDFTDGQARSGAQIAEFIEEWLAGHPEELGAQQLDWLRERSFRLLMRSSCFLRVPADENWNTAKGPAEHTAAPGAPITDAGVDADTALPEVVLRHLRAFGPAAAEDVAYWLGCRVTQIRLVLDELGDRLVRLTDDAGRALFDLPEAPRPDPTTPAPVRLLPWFDSALLAYHARRRTRILPDAYKDAVYTKANLQLLPTILIDGLVAGTWSMETKQSRGGSVCVILKPFTEPRPKDRTALAEEAQRLARFMRPEAASHTIRFNGP